MSAVSRWTRPWRTTRIARDACPQCGSTGIAIVIGIAEEVNIACGIEIGTGPGDYERDAARRWTKPTRRCVRSSSRSRTMIATRFSTRSGGCTQCSSIYGRCGETLIDEHGIVARGVDDVIDTSPIAIALAHDLGNVAKHGSPLTRPPRSGYQPTFRLPQATRPGSGGPWMFRLDVGYDGTSVNGVDVARNAVDKWPEYLTGWGLV